MANVLFIDTETTGLGRDDQPISVGAVLTEVNVENAAISMEVASYNGLRDPSCEISQGAGRVHGISKTQLKDKELDLRELVCMFGVAELIVAHNAQFDRRILRFVDNDKHNWGCSCWEVDWPDEIGGRSLDAICMHYGINRPEIHNALADTRAMMNALQQQQRDGLPYLRNLLHKRGLLA